MQKIEFNEIGKYSKPIYEQYYNSYHSDDTNDYLDDLRVAEYNGNLSEDSTDYISIYDCHIELAECHKPCEFIEFQIKIYYDLDYYITNQEYYF